MPVCVNYILNFVGVGSIVDACVLCLWCLWVRESIHVKARMFVVPPYIQTAAKLPSSAGRRDLLGVVREAPLVETRVCTLAAATLFSPSETLVFSRKKWGLGQIWKAKIRVFRRKNSANWTQHISVHPSKISLARKKTRRVHHEFDRLRFAKKMSLFGQFRWRQIPSFSADYE
jgi:hypothetical protein